MVPGDLKYTPTHEWVRVDGDEAAVGITDHAQATLGAIAFVELPAPGRQVTAREACGVIESVKAATDIFAPVAGRIVAVNEALRRAPEKINDQPYGAGWLFRLRLSAPAELEALLDAGAYARIVD